MKVLKFIALLTIFLLPTLSHAYRFISTNGDTLVGNKSTDLVMIFDAGGKEKEEGKLYIAAVEQTERVLYFLSKDKKWIKYLSESGPAFFKEGEFSDRMLITTINAEETPVGRYSLFLVITKEDPLEIDPAKIKSHLLEIKPTKVRGAEDPNTDILGKYFEPMLPERTLGDYSNVVKSFEVWSLLNEDERKVTLFWKDKKLITRDDGSIDDSAPEKVFDDLRYNSYGYRVEPVLNLENEKKITIQAPLTATHATAYPGCIGGRLNRLARICGELKDEGFVGSEVFSQRWTREDNVDLTEENKEGIYELSLNITTEDVLTPKDFTALRQEGIQLFFEASVSKVPGDFSDTDHVCKMNSAIQYKNRLSIILTQKGLNANDALLSEGCRIDSTELTHYYINVRAVHIDEYPEHPEKNQIVESKCKAGPPYCKVIISTFLN